MVLGLQTYHTLILPWVLPSYVSLSIYACKGWSQRLASHIFHQIQSPQPGDFPIYNLLFLRIFYFLVLYFGLTFKEGYYNNNIRVIFLPESLAVNSMDMSVLERLKWVQQQQHLQTHIAQNNNLPEAFAMLQANGSSGRELKRLETYLGNDDLPSFGHFHEFSGNYNMGFVSPHDAMDGCISRTNSCHMEAIDASLMEKEDEAEGLALNKRKAEFEVGEESKEKKDKREVEVSESGMKRQSIDNTESSQMCSDTSKENSKALEIQKPDYIHVRARRGQATDRHSLAERARREKISKKMKYLQDLVPGCNKITGKASMLDEIINYVQSLQRQVEFLSMKLAVLNPTIGYKADALASKQFPAYVASFPAAAKPSDMANLTCLQFNPLHQGAVDFWFANQNQTTSHQNTMSPESKVQHCLAWDSQTQNLYNASSPGFEY